MTTAIVTGGRDYTNADRVRVALSRAVERLHLDTVIEGGAKGADSLAREASLALGLSVIEFQAAWDVHGKQAGVIRNAQMLACKPVHFVIAFPGGSGTAHMRNIAKAAGVKVYDIL